MLRTNFFITGLLTIFATGGLGYFVFGNHGGPGNVCDEQADADVIVVQDLCIDPRSNSGHQLDYGKVTGGTGFLYTSNVGEWDMDLTPDGDITIYDDTDVKPATFVVTGQAGADYQIDIINANDPDPSIQFYPDGSTGSFEFWLEHTGGNANASDGNLVGGSEDMSAAVDLEFTNATPGNYSGEVTYQVMYI